MDIFTLILVKAKNVLDFRKPFLNSNSMVSLKSKISLLMLLLGDINGRIHRNAKKQ